MENETGVIWKWVEGFEEYYKVSNTGLVKSFRYLRGSIIPNKIIYLNVECADGDYPHVALSKPGQKPINFKVHQLVMSAFGPPKPSSLHEINHKDNNKRNNKIDNLFWGTKCENIQQSLVDNELYGRKMVTRAKLTEDVVREILKTNPKTCKEKRALALKYNVSLGNIYAIVDRRSWTFINI